MHEEPSIDQAFLKKLTEIIETNLEDEQFGVKELADKLSISRSQLHRRLSTITGKSTSQFIREYRLEKAMEMLQNNVATASEIAYRVGFGSPSYFNTCFHKYYGYPPGEVKLRNNLTKEYQAEGQYSNQKDTVTIKKKLYNLRTYIIGILLLILVIFLGYYIQASSEKTKQIGITEQDAIGENSIAVLPFKNMSGKPENEAFCDGMTGAIISRLSKIKDIDKVISQTSVMTFKGKNKTMSEIADELNVHFILESGFQKYGNDIKINLQLIDGATDRLFWSEEYEGQYDSIFKIQAHVAEIVAKQLDAQVTTEEQKDIQKSMTKSLEAYDYYLQGMFMLNYPSTKKIMASRKYFEKAIALDSSFVEAYLELGRSYALMGTWFGNLSKKEADSLAAPYLKKALELDPKNLDALFTMAEKEFFNWNFRVADSMLKVYSEQRGINFYSIFLDLMMGRNDQIIKTANQRIKKGSNNIDAQFPIIFLAYSYYYTNEIDSILVVIRKSLEERPNYEPEYDHFGNIYLAIGDYDKALEVLLTGLQISDKRHASILVHLALVYHFLGDEKKSLQFLNEVIDRAKNGEPEINVFVAHYYARLGDNDEAFKWLDIAYKKHEVDLIWLKSDPNLNLLKDDPRYKALCKKIGFLEVK